MWNQLPDWELQSRAVFRRRERGTVSHAITFLDDMVVHTPMLDAWDQFVWLLIVAIPCSAMQAEQYGYCHRNAVDLGAVMPATEFRVTDEEGTYLCVAHGLVFKGSILAYNPARDEVEWVPAHGVANDLSWAEERMAVALANLCPVPAKRRIASQSSGHVAWPGLMTPVWKRRVRRCRRRMICMRIMSVGRWRDEGNQTPKHHLVMKCAVGVRPNQRWSHKDDRGSGHP